MPPPEEEEFCQNFPHLCSGLLLRELSELHMKLLITDFSALKSGMDDQVLKALRRVRKALREADLALEGL